MGVQDIQGVDQGSLESVAYLAAVKNFEIWLVSKIEIMAG
jgi:hypothetical protein